MRTPIRPIPAPVERWIARARRLRWLDALGGWLLLWLVLTVWPGHLAPGPAALAALIILGALATVAPLRLLWRVVSGAVGLWTSRTIAVGDRAWCIGPDSARRVIVTARHGAHMTVAMVDGDAVEGVRVRRTRVLLVAG
jgi:hypothetical protein